MARPKRSLSSLLDGDDLEAAAPDPVVPPKALAVASPLEEPSTPVVSVEAPPSAPVEPPPAQPDVDAVVETSPGDDNEHAGGPADAPAEPTHVASDPPAVIPAPPPPVVAIESKPANSRAVGSVRAIKAAPELPPSLPLYLELTRKEARFRQDQLNDLTTLTRQLNRRRASTGERITDNTLIRVAVDMLLKVADSLDGATEAELLSAVSARLKR